MVVLKNRVFEEESPECVDVQEVPSHVVDPWDMRSSGINAEEASGRRVSDAIERGIRSKRIPFLSSDNLSALRNLGLVRGGMLTNAAALMFCRSAAPLIVCQAYDSPRCDVLLEALDCYGPIEDAFDAALAFLGRFAAWAFPASGLDGRKALSALSIVFEGCLSNALVHRDYCVFAPVRALVCPGSIEISSPGAFPEGLLASVVPGCACDPARYAEYALEAQTVTRNALLLQALYRFGLIDAQGSGMMRAVFAGASCGLEITWSNKEGCAWAIISERFERRCV